MQIEGQQSQIATATAGAAKTPRAAARSLLLDGQTPTACLLGSTGACWRSSVMKARIQAG
jgi:hypothetical protein